MNKWIVMEVCFKLRENCIVQFLEVSDLNGLHKAQNLRKETISVPINQIFGQKPEIKRQI